MASAMIRPNVVGFLDEMLKSEKHLRVEELTVPVNFPPTRIGDLRLRGADYILLAVREEGEWVFNPPDDYLLYASNVIIAMASPAGRSQIEAHLIDMLLG